MNFHLIPNGYTGIKKEEKFYLKNAFYYTVIKSCVKSNLKIKSEAKWKTRVNSESTNQILISIHRITVFSKEKVVTHTTSQLKQQKKTHTTHLADIL